MSIFDAIILSKNGVVRLKYFWEDFRTIKSCSNTCFLDIALDIATSGLLLLIFDAINIKQKRMSSTKVVDVFLSTF